MSDRNRIKVSNNHFPDFSQPLLSLYQRESRGFSLACRGRGCLQGNLWFSPPASMTLRLASETFKMASKVFIEETDKNFEFITEILFRFLRTFFKRNVQWSNEF